MPSHVNLNIEISGQLVDGYFNENFTLTTTDDTFIAELPAIEFLDIQTEEFSNIPSYDFIVNNEPFESNEIYSTNYNISVTDNDSGDLLFTKPIKFRLNSHNPVDFNSDLSVNEDDYMWLIYYILGGNNPVFYNIDGDENGIVNASDLAHLSDWINEFGDD